MLRVEDDTGVQSFLPFPPCRQPSPARDAMDDGTTSNRRDSIDEMFVDASSLTLDAPTATLVTERGISIEDTFLIDAVFNINDGVSIDDDDLSNGEVIAISSDDSVHQSDTVGEISASQWVNEGEVLVQQSNIRRKASGFHKSL